MKRILIALLASITVAAAVPATVFARGYVALGDSVASGAGLPHAQNASAQDILCDRSPYAYGHIIAKELNVDFRHSACSGAKADEGLYGKQEIDGTRLARQLDAAFADGTPEIVTITIGANDMRWTSILRDCYTWRCGSDWDNVRLSMYKTDLTYELWRTLSEIQWRSGSDAPPKVLLNGYFKPFSANHLGCSDARFISEKEVSWLNQRTDDLNDTIASATTGFTFANYVPLDFSGHELCTDSPWIQGRKDTAPFHPTISGQQAIARANLQFLQ